ncbi:ACS family glucarate transporter-like MFS transporter [Amycolatopsis bartoniae]|uniref:MFS transporter n=1 Tax=Amycolatopsis bartoniae TaxID=941986 RepID=A0A8H9MEE7_9PSEU|nr:MFS transporter [Amycolatopsis bartoniae]MBB2935580.1 ACS family glucarate transporter-like MFS transporter [Amycolatopsis bartoniae]TVT05235.1 MFS transporter [Amycolatopsis bartoniae]GHF76854.1 MFS transporter [Amycolatopsis bartoniae]
MKNLRWYMAGLCSLSFVVNYIDRTTLSVALPYMSEDIHLTPTEQGFALSAFFLTYALSQLPAGALIDKHGVRRVFGIGALVWGGVTMLVGLIRNGALLIAARLVLGVGESVGYPACAKVVSNWFPRSERSFANSVWDNGSRVGAVLALPVVSTVIAVLSWHWAFVFTGALALLWVVLWFTTYRDPDEHPKLTDEERTKLVEGGARFAAQDDAGPKVRWRTLFRHRTVWAMMVGFFCLNYVLFFFITWFPSYLVSARGFDLLKLGIFGTIPGIVAIGGSALGGYTSDALLRRGWTLTRARKTCLVGGLLVSSVIAGAVFVDSAGVALALLSISYASLAFTAASIASLPADVAPTPRQVSSLAGIQNFASNIAGVSGPLITGALVSLAGGSYVVPLVVSGAVAVVGALVYGFGLPKVEPLPLPRSEVLV